MKRVRSCRFTDTDFTSSALYTYKVVCVNELGEGMPAEVKVFIGTDITRPQ